MSDGGAVLMLESQGWGGVGGNFENRAALVAFAWAFLFSRDGYIYVKILGGFQAESLPRGRPRIGLNLGFEELLGKKHHSE
jgi:hypothetical protein